MPINKLKCPSKIVVPLLLILANDSRYIIGCKAGAWYSSLIFPYTYPPFNQSQVKIGLMPRKESRETYGGMVWSSLVWSQANAGNYSRWNQ
jgi:hypothetical protein